MALSIGLEFLGRANASNYKKEAKGEIIDGRLMNKEGGAMKTTISEHFEGLCDPRVERTKLHPLINILSIALCGVLSGADDWVAIEAYGHAKQAFLSTCLDLTNGIPAHDTFARVFALLDPEQFQRCFLNWIQTIETLTGGEVIAIDGKRLCGSQAAGRGKGVFYFIDTATTEN